MSTQRSFRQRPVVSHQQIAIADTSGTVFADHEDVHQTNIGAIPIPPITLVPNYEQSMAGIHYRQPQYFVKGGLTPFFTAMPINTRYEPIERDVQWLKKHNGQHKGAQRLTLVQMAKVLQAWEMEVGRISRYLGEVEKMGKRHVNYTHEYVPLVRATEIAAGEKITNAVAIQALFQYWCSTRKWQGKALMRYFWPIPDMDDPSHKTAFRPRYAGRRQSRRNPLKNNLDSYRKMKHLQQNHDELQVLLKLILVREKTKLEGLLLDAQAFDERLSATPLGSSFHLEVRKLLKANTLVATMRTKMMQNLIPTPAAPPGENVLVLSVSSAARVSDTDPKALVPLPVTEKPFFAAFLRTSLPNSAYVKDESWKKDMKVRRKPKSRKKSRVAKLKRRAAELAVETQQRLTNHSAELRKRKQMKTSVQDSDSEYSDDTDDTEYYAAVTQFVKKRRVDLTEKVHRFNQWQYGRDTQDEKLWPPMLCSGEETGFASMECVSSDEDHGPGFTLLRERLHSITPDPATVETKAVPVSARYQPLDTSKGVVRPRLTRGNRIVFDMFAGQSYMNDPAWLTAEGTVAEVSKPTSDHMRRYGDRYTGLGMGLSWRRPRAMLELGSVDELMPQN